MSPPPVWPVAPTCSHCSWRIAGTALNQCHSSGSSLGSAQGLCNRRHPLSNSFHTNKPEQKSLLSPACCLKNLKVLGSGFSLSSCPVTATVQSGLSQALSGLFLYQSVQSRLVWGWMLPLHPSHIPEWQPRFPAW